MTWEVGKTYQMRGGGEFHVLEIDGPGCLLFGRAMGYPCATWVPAQRTSEGRVIHSSTYHIGDLMPPTPPVVVSDAVSNAFIAAHGPSFCRGAITAAITEWLTEHPHMLRAWQEGPK